MLNVQKATKILLVACIVKQYQSPETFRFVLLYTFSIAVILCMHLCDFNLQNCLQCICLNKTWKLQQNCMCTLHIIGRTPWRILQFSVSSTHPSSLLYNIQLLCMALISFFLLSDILDRQYHLHLVAPKHPNL